MAEPGRVAARPGARPETHKLHFCVLCCLPWLDHLKTGPGPGLWRMNSYISRMIVIMIRFVSNMCYCVLYQRHSPDRTGLHL